MTAPHLTIPLDVVLPLLLPHLQATAAQVAADYRASLPAVPQADPQVSVPTAAELLGLSPETVRGYLHQYLADPRHPRALPFVATSDHPRGHRVRLSALNAWQERNVPGAAPIAAPPARAARRRAA